MRTLLRLLLHVRGGSPRWILRRRGVPAVRSPAASASAAPVNGGGEHYAAPLEGLPLLR